MKKLFFIFSILIGLSFTATAQNVDAETIKTVIKTEKRIFFMENMDIPLDQATRFWELYDKFELDNSEISREKTKLFESLIAKTEGLTDDDAKEMLDKLIVLQQQELKIKKKHLKVMQKELSPKIAARFFQLNELVNSFLKTQILSELPIVETKK